MTESERLWREIEALPGPSQWKKKPKPKRRSFSWASPGEPYVQHTVKSKVLDDLVDTWLIDGFSGLVGEYRISHRDNHGAYWHEISIVAAGPWSGFAPGDTLTRPREHLRVATDAERCKIKEAM